MEAGGRRRGGEEGEAPFIHVHPQGTAMDMHGGYRGTGAPVHLPVHAAGAEPAASGFGVSWSVANRLY